jgi:hypothetical protein
VQQLENLGTLFDAHVRAEFEARDINATMATMTILRRLL